MQAQTTRTFSGNLQKLAGGLIITAALAAGVIGLSTTGALDFSRGSDAPSIAAPVYDTYTGPRHGEGLPLALDTTSIQIDRVSHDRQLAAPQGEGYPFAREIPAIVAQPAGGLTQTRKIDAPQGEGFPMADHIRFIEDNVFEYAATPMTSEQVRFHEENVWEPQGHARTAGDADAAGTAQDYRFLEENVWEQQSQMILPANTGTRDY